MIHKVVDEHEKANAITEQGKNIERDSSQFLSKEHTGEAALEIAQTVVLVAAEHSLGFINR